MKTIILTDYKFIDEVVEIHMETFTGFFLTFLGKGFLRQLYKGFIQDDKSNIIASFDDDKPLGFIAYSEDISNFYKYLIKKRIMLLAFYSFLAFLKNPKILFRLLRAFTYSENSKRENSYIDLSSIGVLPKYKNNGVGTILINKLKETINNCDYKFEYIKLETDAINNDAANSFYVKNGFELSKSYITKENRVMNEYRLYLE